MPCCLSPGTECITLGLLTLLKKCLVSVQDQDCSCEPLRSTPPSGKYPGMLLKFPEARRAEFLYGADFGPLHSDYWVEIQMLESGAQSVIIHSDDETKTKPRLC